MFVLQRVRTIFTAALVALVVAVPVVVRLATVPPQFPHRQWLIEEPSPLVPHPLPMAFAGFIDGADTFRVQLASDDLQQLLLFDEIAVILSNQGTKAVFIEASLSLDGTSCRYVTRPRTTFVNNEPLWLIQDGPCHVPEDDQPRLTLDVRLVVDSGRMSLWTFEDPAATARLLVAPSDERHRLVVRGLAGRTMPPSAMTRAELIGFAWGLTAIAVWGGVVGSLLFVMAGAALLVAADRPASPWFAATGTAMLVFAGAECRTARSAPPVARRARPSAHVCCGQPSRPRSQCRSARAAHALRAAAPSSQSAHSGRRHRQALARCVGGHDARRVDRHAQSTDRIVVGTSRAGRSPPADREHAPDAAARQCAAACDRRWRSRVAAFGGPARLPRIARRSWLPRHSHAAVLRYGSL